MDRSVFAVPLGPAIWCSMVTRRQSLQTVLEAIDRIRLYMEEGRETFFSDELIQEAVCRNLRVIREKCSKAAPDLLQSFHLLGPDSPVTLLCGPEKDYYGAGQAMVWSFLEEELSALKEAVEEAAG